MVPPPTPILLGGVRTHARMTPTAKGPTRTPPSFGVDARQVQNGVACSSMDDSEVRTTPSSLTGLEFSSFAQNDCDDVTWYGCR